MADGGQGMSNQLCHNLMVSPIQPHFSPQQPPRQHNAPSARMDGTYIFCIWETLQLLSWAKDGSDHLSGVAVLVRLKEGLDVCQGSRVGVLAKVPACMHAS